MGASYHDGTGIANECAATRQNIMTAESAVAGDDDQAENPYKFSRCSVKQMKKFLTT